VLDLFAKSAGLKTREGYHRCDAATAVRTTARSARFERVSTPDREAVNLRASRASALRVFLGGPSIIVTQFLSPVLGSHVRNASHKSP